MQYSLYKEKSKSFLYTFAAVISVIALIALTFTAVLHAEETEIVGTSMEQAREVVAKFTSAEAPGMNCSAVVVAPEIALTAGHCADIPSPQLELESGFILPVESVNPVEGRDLAVMIVPDLGCPCAFIDYDNPALKDEIAYAVGYPFNLIQILTTGYIQDRSIEDDVEYLLSTTPVAPGNSGGGLFVVRDGYAYLVGIIVAYAGTNHIAASVELK